MRDEVWILSIRTVDVGLCDSRFPQAISKMHRYILIVLYLHQINAFTFASMKSQCSLYNIYHLTYYRMS